MRPALVVRPPVRQALFAWPAAAGWPPVSAVRRRPPPSISASVVRRPRFTSTKASSPPPPPSLSYGPSDPPLLTQTIPAHFASIVARFPDRPAVVCRAPVSEDAAAAPARETVYTYGDLDRVSDLLARALQQEGPAGLGVRRGDRVAVSLGNGPAFAALTYALYKLGAVLVPLNPAFTAAQVAAALQHLAVEVLVVGAVTDLAYKPARGRSNLPLLQALAGGAAGLAADPGRLVCPDVPSLRRIVLVDNTPDHPAVAAAADFADPAVRLRALTPWAALTGGADLEDPAVLAALARDPARPRPAPLPEALRPADTISIQFTSGTTSQPKAAMLSHTAILNNGYLVGQRMGLAPDDRIVCPPPLFHCFGAVLGYMATATSGAALLLPSPAFDPAAALLMAADHRASGLYGVATMFVSMLEVLEQVGRGGPQPNHGPAGRLTPAAAAALPTHLRTGIAAGSSVPESLMRRLFASLGLRGLVICYGMTETAPVSCMTAPADPLPKRTATVGRPLPHTAVQIVDPADRARVLPRGQPGELAASGYLVMRGYWGDAAQTAAVLAPDPATGVLWMHSGDEAVMDADGYVAVTGRLKDLVIRGGENIHPLEIENCLFQHPRVAEASVVGVPDPRHGEAVAAFVVPHARVPVAGGHTVRGGEYGELPGPTADAGDDPLTPDAVRAWVRDRLSPHLVPKHVFWTAAYPKTASGKIQKFKLRETATALLAD